jgi:LacI family transcriptional regulator
LRKKTAAAAAPASIPAIARELGVSIGTVDRALHDRPGINNETRARVLRLAKKLGYRPNPAARFLVSKKRIRIGVNLPREIASFWDRVRDGIQDAARSLETIGVEVVWRTYTRLGQGERAALESALADDIQGLVLAPGRSEDLAPLLDAKPSIPVVCVNTGAPEIAALSTISVDSTANGAMVAELLGRFIGDRGDVAVVTGQLTTADHALKLDGFRRTLAALRPRVAVRAVVEAHDDAGEAYEKCRQLIDDEPSLAGLYVATANSLPVIRAVKDAGRRDRLTVITTDLFPDLVPLIESGAVTATIHQRPWVQGQMAFRAISRFLTLGLLPPANVRLAPHVVLRSNLQASLDEDRSEPEEAMDRTQRTR